jgi:hypothetical protein
MSLKTNNTTIFVWPEKFSNKSLSTIPGNPESHYFGLGDVLRGLATTGKVCRDSGSNFAIDMRHNSFGKLFTHQVHGHERFVDEQSNNIPIVDYYRMNFCVKEYGERASTKTLQEFISHDTPVNCLFTNHHAGNLNRICRIYREVRQKIKTSFQPTSDARNMFEQWKLENNIPEKYTVIHARLGDVAFGEFLNHPLGDNPLPLANKLHSHIKNNLKYDPKQTVIISDNTVFLNLVSNLEKDYVVPKHSIIAHVGKNNSDKATYSTFFDFMLVVNSQQNHTYSVYPWKSGFVNNTSIIFNVHQPDDINIFHRIT